MAGPDQPDLQTLAHATRGIASRGCAQPGSKVIPLSFQAATGAKPNAMLYFTRAKTFGIRAALRVLAFLLSLPNLSAAAGLAGRAFVPWNQVHLGLDLRGGSYLLLQIRFFGAVRETGFEFSLVDQVRQNDARRRAVLYRAARGYPANNQVVLHLLNAGRCAGRGKRRSTNSSATRRAPARAEPDGPSWARMPAPGNISIPKQPR